MKVLRWIFLLAALALMFALGAGVGFIAPRLVGWRSQQKFWDTATVVRQVQTLSQLVTVKFVMEKMVVLEDVQGFDVKWAFENKVLMVAHGVVKAGVDLGQLTARDVKISGTKIIIVLPPPRITDAYLDEKQTQIVEHTTGLLRGFDKDLEQSARQQALADISRAARRGGILQEANERAKSQLGNLFHQLGFETVEFREASPSLPAGG